MISAAAAYTTANATRAKAPVHVVKLGQHPNALIGAWTLSEASGTRVDYTGRNDLLPSGTPTTSAGKISSLAVQLDGSDYLYRAISDNNCLIINDESFMGSVWLYLDSKAANKVAISQWSTLNSNQSWWIGYTQASDRLSFNVQHSGGAASVLANNLGSPSTGTWYFVVWWYDKAAGTINIRVNNGTANSTSIVGFIFQASTYQLVLGGGDFDANGSPTDTTLNGRLEQFLFWARILTSAEQTTLYNGGSGLAMSSFLDPATYQFATGGNSAGENLGSYVLEPGSLIYETTIDKLEGAPLATFTFALQDVGGAVSTIVASNIIGYKIRLYSGYFGLPFANFVQTFGGRITEFKQEGPLYRFVCRSFLTYAQSKLVFKDQASNLTVAVGPSDTTFSLQDASSFPSAQSTPQSFRRIAHVDNEIVTYRGKSLNDLTSVVRSASTGFAFPPAYGAPADHAVGAVVRQLAKMGALTTDNSQAQVDWSHPVRMLQDIIGGRGNTGLGEFLIPISLSSFDSAMAALGMALQFRYVFDTGVNGKKLLEEICRDIAGYLIEKADGTIALKLLPQATTLHAAWKFESIAGLTAGPSVDIMHVGRSRNYDLPGTDNFGIAAGKIGNAMDFLGVNYLYSNSKGLHPAGASFSVAVWVFLDTKGAGTREIVGQWGATAATQAWRIIYNGTVDRFQFVTGEGTTNVALSASSFGSPSTGTWYLITASFARDLALSLAGTGSISVNGGTVDTTTLYNPVPTLETFKVGNGLDGRVDELGMWFDHVLTSSEIAWLYNSGTGRAIEDFAANFPSSSPAPVDTVTDAHLLARPKCLRNATSAYNQVTYYYDFVPPTNSYASTFEYRDNSLIDTVGKVIPLEIFSRGIRSRHFDNSGGIFVWFDATERFLMNRAEAIIQRFGREAPVIGATAHYRKHLLETLDDVTATFDQVIDLGTGSRSLSGASCEVTRLRQNLKTYELELELVKYP